MKRISMLLMAMVFVGSCAFAQTHEVKLPAKPSIVDLFLAAVAYDKCDDADYLQFAVEAVKGKPESFVKTIVDRPNGYLKVEIGSNEDGKVVESCYWKMNNGHQLLALRHVASCDEEDSLHFFEFDKEASTVKELPLPFNLGLGQGAKFDGMMYELPRTGKTIKGKTYSVTTSDGDPFHWDITWNGSKFVVKQH